MNVRYMYIVISSRAVGMSSAISGRAQLAATIRSLLASPSSKTSPALAKSVLTHPPSTPSPTFWRDYLLERNFLNAKAFASAPTEAQDAALAALSAALTFPLTMARSFSALFPNQPSPANPRLMVVGARAEATLPLHFWGELALLTETPSLSIDCCGPAAMPGNTPVHQAWTSNDGQHRLTVTLRDASLFHESSMGKALLKGQALAAHDELPDAFVLFNPGLGEPGWERAWGPSIRALHAADRPMLLTALSPSDAERDRSFIHGLRAKAPALATSSAAVPYLDNPAGSLLGAEAPAPPPPSAGQAASSPSTANQQGARGKQAQGQALPRAVSSRPSNTHYRVLLPDPR